MSAFNNSQQERRSIDEVKRHQTAAERVHKSVTVAGDLCRNFGRTNYGMSDASYPNKYWQI